MKTIGVNLLNQCFSASHFLFFSINFLSENPVLNNLSNQDPDKIILSRIEYHLQTNSPRRIGGGCRLKAGLRTLFIKKVNFTPPPKLSLESYYKTLTIDWEIICYDFVQGVLDGVLILSLFGIIEKYERDRIQTQQRK